MAERVVRPESIDVGHLKVRPHRKPTASNPCWSWRITTRGRGFRVLASGRWTPEEAVRKAAEILVQSPQTDVRTLDTVPKNVDELLAVYANVTYVGSTRHAKSTLANVKRCINHIRRIIGSVPLAGMTRETIARYVRHRENEGRAPSTIKKEWVVLAQAWKFGRESLWVTGELPRHGIESDRRVYNHQTPTHSEILRVQDQLKALAESRKNGAHWPWMALEIALHTGARVGTIERLRVCDFREIPDKKISGRLRLTGKKTRSNPTGEREIPIPNELVQSLKLWMIRRGQPQPNDRLLGVKGKLIRSRGREKLVSACTVLGIEPFTWHGVRRWKVRELRRRGMSVTAAAAFLGHSPAVMLRMYDEISDGDLVDELSEVWEASANG